MEKESIDRKRATSLGKAPRFRSINKQLESKIAQPSASGEVMSCRTIERMVSIASVWVQVYLVGFDSLGLEQKEIKLTKGCLWTRTRLTSR